MSTTCCRACRIIACRPATRRFRALCTRHCSDAVGGPESTKLCTLGRNNGPNGAISATRGVVIALTRRETAAQTGSALVIAVPPPNLYDEILFKLQHGVRGSRSPCCKRPRSLSTAPKHGRRIRAPMQAAAVSTRSPQQQTTATRLPRGPCRGEAWSGDGHAGHPDTRGPGSIMSGMRRQITARDRAR